MFEPLEALLAQSSGAKVFPGRQVAPEWIEDAERELGLPFPATYRCWLQTYGNLLVGSSPVLMLCAPDHRDLADDDLIYYARLDAVDGVAPKGLIALHVPDSDEAFYFDTRTGLKEGEYPILRFDYTDGSYSHFADASALFLEDLVRRT